MEYVYAAMLLHKAGQGVSADALTKTLTAAGVSVDEARVKATAAALADVDIDKVIEELKKGADFKELAKNQSDDESSRETGGDLDYIYKGIFDASFDEAAEKLNPGEISEKIKTKFGFHVIQLIEKKPPELATFDEMKPGIQKHLFLEEAKKQVASYIEELKQTASIETFF